MSEFAVTARWLFPVAQPPLENGLLVIDGERVAGVFPKGNRKADLDLGNAAILPGLVNAHTHLDLTGMRGLAPPSPDFVGWLKQVIAFRRQRTPAQVAADIRYGLSESLRAGTTLLGDISAGGASWAELATSLCRSIVFYELLGLTDERATAAFKAFESWRTTVSDSANCRGGFSPHAPYSAHGALFGLAAVWEAPAAVHLAESKAEMELMLTRTGPFVDFLKELGVWNPTGIAPLPDIVLISMNASTPVLFVHCNYLTPDAPFPTNSSVVYCPRTHAAFGHPPHPFREFLARGIRVALGTDSLASNPDLSILNEMRFLREHHPDLRGDLILRIGTLTGAEALGWADECGSLEVGKSADFVASPLADRESKDAHDLWLESEKNISRLWIRGTEVKLN
jgi:cytosine/adenosine deaminase-related metal-dependent hydrolase